MAENKLKIKAWFLIAIIFYVFLILGLHFLSIWIAVEKENNELANCIFTIEIIGLLILPIIVNCCKKEGKNTKNSGFGNMFILLLL